MKYARHTSHPSSTTRRMRVSANCTVLTGCFRYNGPILVKHVDKLLEESGATKAKIIAVAADAPKQASTDAERVSYLYVTGVGCAPQQTPTLASLFPSPLPSSARQASTACGA